jgi:outer membrane protein insertion porin family
LRKFIFSIFIVILTATAAFSQTGDNDIGGAEESVWQKRILSVDVIGAVTADTFLILNSSKLVPGELLSPGMTQDAIKGVFGLGLFSDVRVDADLEEGGVRLKIVVEEYPRVRKLNFYGNKKIKKKKFTEVMTLFEGRLVSRYQIKNNIDRILKLYEEKGYLLVDIDVEQIPVEGEEGLVDLKFRINEGDKVRVKRITFKGNREYTDKKLRSKMSTKQKGFLRSGSFEKEKYLEDKDKVIEFYKKNGYTDAVVLGDSIWYSDDKTRMFIEIEIREGTKFFFGKFTWEGNTVIPDEKIDGRIKQRKGEVYNQEKYDETLFKFYEMYQDLGYWYLQIDENTTSRGDTLDFHFVLTENDPAYIRKINVAGNTKTREKVIRRELYIKPGMIFKRSLLGRSLREVMILNFFGDVVPDWEILPNRDIDLIIRVEEKPTGQFSVGAGYSARDKFVGTVGLGVPNLFGTGQTATLNVDFGKVRNSFDASYQEPWLFDTPTSIYGHLYIQNRRWYDWFDEVRLGGSIRLGRRLRWPDNFFQVYGGYRLEQVKYKDISSEYIDSNIDNPYSVDKQDWPRITSATSVTILRDSRDLPQFPTEGSVVSWGGELAGTVFGGSWDYFKYNISAEYYQKLLSWPTSLVAMAKARFGEIDGINDGERDIPYGERFSPGGVDPDGTIRGYDDGRVGPRDEYGAYLRGRFEIIYNFELSLSLKEQTAYILLFADAGNAYLNFENVTPFRRLNRSVGFGFRIVIPFVGIMGFDFGYPFDGLDRHEWKSHFQIGRGF